MPNRSGQRPVISPARVGEQIGAAWKPVRFTPVAASRSRFGVGIVPPSKPTSANPRSSATITSTFGFSAAAAGKTSSASAAQIARLAKAAPILGFFMLLDFTDRAIVPGAATDSRHPREKFDISTRGYLA
jgi:hypothetical protein